jgi:hypothetical protein
VFTYEGPSNGAGSNAWSLVGQSGYSGTLPQVGTPYNEATFAFEAKVVYEGAVAEVKGVSYFDNQGCDDQASSLTCTNAGFCCDTHDQCYAQNACTAGSWTWPANTCPGCSAACQGCNLAAANCIANAEAANLQNKICPGSMYYGMPSSCCQYGTCGQGWSSCCSGSNCQCELGSNGQPCVAGTPCPGAYIASGSACPQCPPDGGTDSPPDSAPDSPPDSPPDTGYGEGGGSGEGSGGGSGEGE